MAIVRSLEGTFYDIPESELDQYAVPPDQVKKLMESAGPKIPQGPGPGQRQGAQNMGQGQGMGHGMRGTPQILVQFITQTGPGEPQQRQAPSQGPPAEGDEEKVEPQWYWVNWFNWANWYNWY